MVQDSCLRLVLFALPCYLSLARVEFLDVGRRVSLCTVIFVSNLTTVKFDLRLCWGFDNIVEYCSIPGNKPGVITL